MSSLLCSAAETDDELAGGCRPEKPNVLESQPADGSWPWPADRPCSGSRESQLGTGLQRKETAVFTASRLGTTARRPTSGLISQVHCRSNLLLTPRKWPLVLTILPSPPRGHCALDLSPRPPQVSVF
jgi:hypothetical protein